MKPDKINTIFQMISLSKRGEFALCAYNGVYFIKLKTEIAKLELVVQSESYLPDKCVQKGVEYATDKLIVCVQGDEFLYLIDRAKKSTQKVKTQMSNHFEIFKLPGYSKLPLLILRDDYALKVLNTQTLKIK